MSRVMLKLPKQLWKRLEKILAAGGYEGQEFQAWVKQTFGVDLEISLPPCDTKGLVVVPLRWIVERTFAWLGRYRRLSKDYDQVLVNTEGVV